MKTFSEFLVERENLYKLTNAQLQQKLEKTHKIKIPDEKLDFIEKHLKLCPDAKQNTSLINTLSKSKDFEKIKYAFPPIQK